MSVAFLTFFQLGGIFFDFNIILKIVGMLFIYSFVRSHIQQPVLALALIVFLCAFLLFDFWVIFGGALVLYLLAIFGVMHILVDLSFMHAFTKPLLNIGGMLSPKPHGPTPQQRAAMEEREAMEERRREHAEREREAEYGEEHGEQHGHRNMSRTEMEQRQRMEYERMRRGGTRGRGRDDERGH